MLEMFNQGLIKIKEDGTYYRLFKSFLHGLLHIDPYPVPLNTLARFWLCRPVSSDR